MLHVFIITRNNELKQSIGDYFKFAGNVPVHEYSPAGIDALSPQKVTFVFRQIADWMERAAAQEGGQATLRHSLAFIELSDPALSSFEGLNPGVTDKGGWAAVVAMLVLAFPEVHWVFDSAYRPLDTPLFKRLHLPSDASALADITALHDAGFTPLFDPSGLRNAIRERLQSSPESHHVPVRRETAAAVDEEGAYTYFNAYIAYRLGYRAHVVTSYGMMEEVLARTYPGRHAISLVFEDLYLNFPDKPYDKHLSNLAVRDGSFEGLAQTAFRVLITVGHQRTPDRHMEEKNRDHLMRCRARGCKVKTLYKPLSGIFDVWRRSGLKHWLQDNGGRAPGFIWPPPPEPGRSGVHSAPGRLLEVSDRLSRRAHAVAHDVQTVPDAVYGALLALEAQEYLGHRTPTSSLDALALKHRLEVSAECLFYGVEYNKDVKGRVGEIERDLISIGRWLRPKTRRISKLDAEIGILSDLVIRFREHYQFDEEQKCLAKLRRLHRVIWFHKNKAWAWLFYPFRWYVEFLLSSMLVFAIAIILWVGGLSYAFSQYCVQCHQEAVKAYSEDVEELEAEKRAEAVEPPASAAAPRGDAPASAQATPRPAPGAFEKRRLLTTLHGWGIEHGLAHGVTTFFGVQPAHSAENFERYNELALALNVLAILAGFVHLGVFVSHLYSLVARR